MGPDSPDYECRTCHAALAWVSDDDDLELITLGML